MTARGMYLVKDDRMVESTEKHRAGGPWATT